MNHHRSAQLERARRLAQPLSALLELTYVCNWRCAFCYNPRRFDESALSAAEWKAVLDDLRALGTMNVTLTGGEPLAHAEFLEIAKLVRDRAFDLTVLTNGSLIDESIAWSLASIHTSAVEMSLHGSTPDLHDRATGKPGSFASVRRAIDTLLDAGVRVRLKAPLTSINEHDLDAIFALTDSLGIEMRIDPSLTARDDGDLSPLALTASRDGYRRLGELMVRRSAEVEMAREPGGTNCGLGTTTLAIDPEGNVYPCPKWRKSSLGNVRETRLRELWHPSEERAVLARVAGDVNDRLLESGGVFSSFRFCPALAHEASGDLFLPSVAMEEQARSIVEGARALKER